MQATEVNMLSDLLDARDVSRILKIRLSTVYKYTSAGLIPHVKVLGNLRFRENEIQKFIESNSVKQAANVVS